MNGDSPERESPLTKDEESPPICDAEEDGWGCTLDAGHDGPHEAWGIDRLMCRWWSHGRIPRDDVWRDHLVQDLENDR